MNDTSSPDFWQLRLEGDPATVQDLALRLEEEALSVTAMEMEEQRRWFLEALFADRPDEQGLSALLGGHDFTLALLEAEDWVSRSQEALEPVRAGRFFVHGSHIAPRLFHFRHNIRIDAGRAFGSGLHETTYGCLLAIDRIARGRGIDHALDMGCGSGVLALAIAATGPARIDAIDNDADAVAVTAENARLNHRQRQIRVHLGSDPRRCGVGGCDLIVANILAGPLTAMAPSLSAALAPGGQMVLSGILNHQRRMVERRYFNQGLRRQRCLRIGAWSTLWLEKPVTG